MNTIPSAPAWRLSHLYHSPQDASISRDLRAVDKDIASFERRFRGGKIARLSTRTNALRDMLGLYERIYAAMLKPMNYASLLFAEQTSRPECGAFYQRMKQEYTRQSQRLIFVESDLLDLPRKRLQKLAQSPALSMYKNYLRGLLAQQAHSLPEREEQIFADAALTGSSALKRMFTEEHSRAKYSLKLGRKSREVQEEELLHNLHHKDRTLRKASAQALSSGLQQESRRYAFLLNTLLADKQTQDKYRRYELAEDSRHLANETNKAAVDALVSAVRGSYKLVQHYYGLRAELLGLRKLEDYDRYAPVFSSGRLIPFTRAKTLVTQALKNFSPLLGDIARELFAEKRVDAYARPGKRGGAFCDMGLPPASKPWVFMNYRGSWRDVFTLAHECGHAMHGYLSIHHQGLLNCNPPLTTCETASTFAEALLFDYVQNEKLAARERMGLRVQRIDDCISTVYRQIGMFLFERDCHALYRKKGELSVEEINHAWHTRQSEMLGSSVRLSPGYAYWWAYIPHVFQWPFYVYSYAFGDLLSLSLFDQYTSGQKNFVDHYLAFLSAGSSASPAELMKPFRARLDDSRFWKQGVRIIERQVKDLEKEIS